MPMLEPANAWTQSIDLPSRLFESGSNDYELYEEDGEFVLSVELPGFDAEEITVSWEAGVLNVAGEHEDDRRGTRRTYHRRLRFPQTAADDGTAAASRDGLLTVPPPRAAEAAAPGRETETEA